VKKNEKWCYYLPSTAVVSLISAQTHLDEILERQIIKYERENLLPSSAR
jgi:hypothetical protein